MTFQLNTDQSKAINKLIDFIASDSDFFILKGSAGTGKTSLLKSMIQQAWNHDWNVQIAAPTGRASSVLSTKTAYAARTIHSMIYDPKVKKDGTVEFIPKTNLMSEPTLFMIDEASMVSDIVSVSDQFFAKSSVLDDLFHFVQQGNKKNKILFVGDEYQLPPVHQDFSPALNVEYLKNKYEIKGVEFELMEVMRQSEGSQILEEATKLRDLMKNGHRKANISIDKYRSSFYANDAYLSVFDPARLDSAIVLCYTNADVNYWNTAIRRDLQLPAGELAVGDIISTQASWFGSKHNMDWIYKGEYGRIVDLDPSLENYEGFMFQEIKVAFPMQDGTMREYDAKVLLDVIHTAKGVLHKEQEKILYAAAMRNNPKFRLSQHPADDPYLGAMRLRFGYASTGHKAQGGEWDHVLIHEYKFGQDLQWSYTALTRARERAFTYMRRSA
jgi:exodeoxyribonuclease-5